MNQLVTGPERRRRILDFVVGYAQRHGYAPTVREISAAVGIPATSTTLYHLNRLHCSGDLERIRGVARGLVDPNAVMIRLGVTEVIGETEDGQRVRVRVLEPVPAAA